MHPIIHVPHSTLLPSICQHPHLRLQHLCERPTLNALPAFRRNDIIFNIFLQISNNNNNKIIIVVAMDDTYWSKKTLSWTLGTGKTTMIHTSTSHILSCVACARCVSKWLNVRTAYSCSKDVQPKEGYLGYNESTELIMSLVLRELNFFLKNPSYTILSNFISNIYFFLGGGAEVWAEVSHHDPWPYRNEYVPLSPNTPWVFKV